MTLFLILIHLKSKIFNQKSDDSNGNWKFYIIISSKTFFFKQISLSGKHEELNGKSAGLLSQIQADQIIFYTQYCLLLTLVVFVLSKLFSKSARNETALDNKNVTAFKAATAETHSISTQTDIGSEYFAKEDNTNKSLVRQRTISYNKSIQTPINTLLDDLLIKQPKRTVNQCLDFLKEKKNDDDFLEEEIVELVRLKHIPIYKLETYFSDPIKGIYFR